MAVATCPSPFSLKLLGFRVLRKLKTKTRVYRTKFGIVTFIMTCLDYLREQSTLRNNLKTNREYVSMMIEYTLEAAVSLEAIKNLCFQK